jgi:glutamine amidotransferase
MAQITIVDTGIANISSISNALNIINFSYSLATSASDIKDSSILILPGVGSFASAMNKLESVGIADALRSRVLNDGTPLVGICLGMQLLFDSSDEFGSHKGLGLIQGEVKKLKCNSALDRIPNMGWCEVQSRKEGKIFPELYSEPDNFYHVHSYYAECANEEDIAAVIQFSNQDVCVAVEKDNIFGLQFHPEKSLDSGLNLLNRLLSNI